MMMPANFSAVAENEMTYVVGGGLVDVLAPVMTTENWQNINANLIYLVGNKVLSTTADTALSNVFSGHYVPGKMLSQGWKNLTTPAFSDDNNWALALNILNGGLKVAGYAASIYTLGNKQIGLKFDSLTKDFGTYGKNYATQD